jgi:hypothetical protein
MIKNLCILAVSLICLSLNGCSGCSSNSVDNNSWTASGSDYFNYKEETENSIIETPKEPKNEIHEPDVERIKWDLQKQTFAYQISGRYLRKNNT